MDNYVDRIVRLQDKLTRTLKEAGFDTLDESIRGEIHEDMLLLAKASGVSQMAWYMRIGEKKATH